MKTNKDFFQTKGKVIRLLRNGFFLVECDNGRTIMADIASRFRTFRKRRKAKIVEGDRVVVEITLRDLEKGQIVGFVEV